MINNKYHITVIHGLNIQPIAMIDLVADLDIPTITLSTVQLTGHNESIDAKSRMNDLIKVKKHQWIKDCKSGITSNSTGKSLHIAYSLGATTLLNTYLEYPELIPDRLILMAPAISVNRWTNGWKLFSAFPSLKIPSLQPKHSRSNYFIPINAYRELFQLKGDLKNQYQKFENLKTQIFVNRNDELVSSKGILKIINNNKLENWSLLILNDKKVKFGKRHLIIHPRYMPKNNWLQIQQTTKSFLNV